METESSEISEEQQHLKKQRVSSSEMTHLKLKTQLCRRFMQGICTLGSKCNYAHGFSEIRVPPKICRMFFYNRYCTYGDTCRFLHHDHSSSNMISSSKSQEVGIMQNSGCKIMQTCANATTDGYSSVAAQKSIMQTSSSSPATNDSSKATKPTSLHKNGPYAVKDMCSKTQLQRVSRIYADWI